MTDESGGKSIFLSGKISQTDEVSATIVLETGQKLILPKRFLPQNYISGFPVKISLDLSKDGIVPTEEKKADAKSFLNSLLQTYE